MSFLLFRAALVAALSFSPTWTLAQSKAPKSETYKDIIEKAYNLSLQKDRQQAMIILGNAIQNESRPQAVAELRKTSLDLAHVFLSDKAQQIYESGVSLRRTDLSQAQDKIAEALRLEPDNLSIILEMTRIYVARGECKVAQELVQKHFKTFSFDEELRLSLAQSLACQQKWAEYQKVADPAVLKKSPYSKYWSILEAERLIAAKSYVKAQELLLGLLKSDDKYPGALYWKWKMSALQRKPAPEEGQKYLMTCKNISANQHRQYMMDPMLCRHLTEVEKELKGNHETPE